MLYTSYLSLHTVYYTLECVLYTYYCTLCTVNFILYSVLYTSYCTLHTLHFTPPPSPSPRIISPSMTAYIFLWAHCSRHTTHYTVEAVQLWPVSWPWPCVFFDPTTLNHGITHPCGQWIVARERWAVASVHLPGCSVHWPLARVGGWGLGGGAQWWNPVGHVVITLLLILITS